MRRPEKFRPKFYREGISWKTAVGGPVGTKLDCKQIVCRLAQLPRDSVQWSASCQHCSTCGFLKGLVNF
jgi:hypothetical protein